MNIKMKLNSMVELKKLLTYRFAYIVGNIKS